MVWPSIAREPWVKWRHLYPGPAVAREKLGASQPVCDLGGGGGGGRAHDLPGESNSSLSWSCEVEEILRDDETERFDDLSNLI